MIRRAMLVGTTVPRYVGEMQRIALLPTTTNPARLAAPEAVSGQRVTR